jgi:hypothetical protein
LFLNSDAEATYQLIQFQSREVWQEQKCSAVIGVESTGQERFGIVVCGFSL